jgi:peptidoglycan/LPS O-acetylase OafA/YrhL
MAVALQTRVPSRSSIKTCWRLLVVAAERLALVDAGGIPLSVSLGYPVVALSCVGLVAVALSTEIASLPHFLSTPLGYLGRISYDPYVFHVLAIAIGITWV